MTTAAKPRILWLDLARTIALICMAIFHFCYDLAMFGLIPSEAVTGGPLRMFAILIAGSFLFLSGVSLQIAHGRGIRWSAFWKRWVVVATTAAVISVLTYIWVPQSFIFFGILHAIATFSLLGLLFLRLPAVITLIAAGAVCALPFMWAHSMFDQPLLWWTGLGFGAPSTLDYEPLFPWFAAFLCGMTLAKLLAGHRLLEPRPVSPGMLVLSWPGRHSLWVYLAHQPILVALLWTALQLL